MSQVSELANLIAKELENYSEEVTEKVLEAVDIVSKEANAEIKSNISFKQRTRDYVKAFRITNVYKSKKAKRNIWHVTDGHHRLTHLLENGHALRGGGRARAFPHIKYGDELAKRRMEELAREAIENAGR